MRRLLVAVAFILLAALPAQGQAGNAIALSGIGAPSGACATGLMFYTNVTNSDFYNCPNGAWNKVTGSGSTGSSSSGQALVNSGGSIVGKDIEGTGSALLACTDTSLATGDIWTWDGAKCINTAVGIAINAQTGTTYTVQAGDKGKLVTLSNGSAIAVTLPQATGSFVAPWYTYACNVGAGAVTITPTTSTINGFTTLTLGTGDCTTIVSDSTNYIAFRNIARGEFGFLLGADNGSALTTADDQKSIWINTTGRTVVLTSVSIQCDATDASTSFNIQNNDGSAANILTSDVTCNTTTQSGTISATEGIIAAGSSIDLLTVTANTAKRMTIIVRYR